MLSYIVFLFSNIIKLLGKNIIFSMILFRVNYTRVIVMYSLIIMDL